MNQGNLLWCSLLLAFGRAVCGTLADVSTPAPAPLLASSTNLTGTIADVRHVVIFMQENRSFDNYFGSLAGVRGFGDHSLLVQPNGISVWSQNGLLPYLITNQCTEDISHDWGSSQAVWDSGWWDAWIPYKGTVSMASMDPAQISYYYDLANAYTICDHYFCSIRGPTNPNRLYLWSGMIDPAGTGGGPVIDNSEPVPGFTWTTYPERLQAAGVSWKVYQQSDNYDDNALAWFEQYMSAAPGNPLHDRGVSYVKDVITAFSNDVAHATLPQVSWIIAPTQKSEHPPFPPAAGEVYTRALLDALAANASVLNSTVFVLSYDENDGFFDHVVPPTAPLGTTNEFINGAPLGLGVRVPCILISPWTRGGNVCSETFDHTSILRFLEKWTGVGETNISAWRRQVCGDLTSAFDFAHPQPGYPSLSRPPDVVCDGVVIPHLPDVQAVPPQQAGHKPLRPLPYEPEAWAVVDCGANRVWILTTNSGSASAHFGLYPDAFLATAPIDFDVPPGTTVSNAFALSSGRYALSCYGPAGFVRRFAGADTGSCDSVEVRGTVDAAAGGLVLVLENPTASQATFTITNGYDPAISWSIAVDPHEQSEFSVSGAAAKGWYDLGATVAGAAGFARHFIGHLPTPPPPRLTAHFSAGEFTLSYPGWAAGFSVETNSDLTGGSWGLLPVAGTNVNGNLYLSEPVGPKPLFFRLRYQP